MPARFNKSKNKPSQQVKSKRDKTGRSSSSSSNNNNNLNKYHVRALRRELEDCIRNGNWKKFRTRFPTTCTSSSTSSSPSSSSTTSIELGRAVVECQHKAAYKHSLLHGLCECCGTDGNSAVVPLDIFESVLQVTSREILIKTKPTPLAVALSKKTVSPLIIELLLSYDLSRESLYALNDSGDTPIMQAVKEDLGDAITVSLLQYDGDVKKSLLVPTRKHATRLPLYYVAINELLCMYSFNDELSGELEYFLLETYRALQIKNGEKLKPMHVVKEKGTSFNNEREAGETKGNAIVNVKEEGGDDDDDTDNIYDGMRDEHLFNLIQAAIGCSHILGKRNSGKLFNIIISQLHNIPVTLAKCDARGNTLLHTLCSAPTQQPFLEPCLTFEWDGLDGIIDEHHPDETYITPTNDLLSFLIQVNPSMLDSTNDKGQCPLHLAISSCKHDRVVDLVCTARSIRIRTYRGELPLHLAIESYPPESTQLLKLWQKYPEAASVPHGPTGLFAFQLVAAVAKLAAMALRIKGDEGRGSIKGGGNGNGSGINKKRRSSSGQGHSQRQAQQLLAPESVLTSPSDSGIGMAPLQARYLARPSCDTNMDISVREEVSTIYFFLRGAPQLLQIRR